MKTFSFNLCKYTITVTIEKKPYKTATEKYAEQCAYSFTGWNYDEALKPHTVDAKDVKFGETVVYHGPFHGYESEEIKMEEKTSGEPMVDPNLVLYNYCEKYIESQREILSESTLNGYRNIINNHLGYLMRTYLGDITNEDIQRSFDAEIEKGLSKKTLKGYKSFITKVLAVYRPDFTPEIRIEKEPTDETT